MFHATTRTTRWFLTMRHCASCDASRASPDHHDSHDSQFYSIDTTKEDQMPNERQAVFASKHIMEVTKMLPGRHAIWFSAPSPGWATAYLLLVVIGNVHRAIPAKGPEGLSRHIVKTAVSSTAIGISRQDYLALRIRHSGHRGKRVSSGVYSTAGVSIVVAVVVAAI